MTSCLRVRIGGERARDAAAAARARAGTGRRHVHAPREGARAPQQNGTLVPSLSLHFPRLLSLFSAVAIAIVFDTPVNFLTQLLVRVYSDGLPLRYITEIGVRVDFRFIGVAYD